MNPNYSNNARSKAYEHFGLSVGNSNGMVLHHKDITLKETDIERYNEWRIEDLELLTREEHASIHHTGAKRSKITCENISIANKGIPNNFTFYKNIETGETISVKNGEKVPEGFVRGRILKEESIRKMTESKKGGTPWNKGVPMSREQRDKLKELNKGRFIGGKSPCAKKVAQYTKSGELIRIWDSMQDAERELAGVSRKHIGGCCKGERKTHAGFIWEYYTEE